MDEESDGGGLEEFGGVRIENRAADVVKMGVVFLLEASKCLGKKIRQTGYKGSRVGFSGWAVGLKVMVKAQ